MVARAKFIARLMIATGRRRASWGLKAKGRTYAKDEDLSALFRIVTPGYLSAMGTHLRDGRDFSWQNGPKDQPMVIINRVPGRRFWPAENPLGRMVIINQRDVRVVGVISDVRKNSLEVSAAPEMYLPVMQADPEGAELVVRSKLPPAALPASVMKILRALNPAQPAAELRPLRPIVDRAVSPRRFLGCLWLVCSAGPGVGSSGNLRCHFLFGNPAETRDRDADDSGSYRVASAVRRGCQGSRVGRYRNCAGHGRISRGNEMDCVAVVQYGA
jgi:MacB-like periplasmic core domain